jgi:hypothetical protein
MEDLDAQLARYRSRAEGLFFDNLSVVLAPGDGPDLRSTGGRVLA